MVIGGHFGGGDHFDVGIISVAVQPYFNAVLISNI